LSGYKGHIIGGAIFILIISLILLYFGHSLHINWFIHSWKDWFLLIPILAFFTMLPDIDIQSSIPRAIVTVIGLGFILYFALTRQILAIIVLVLLLLTIWTIKYWGKKWGHRGHCHSIIFIFLVSLLLAYFNWTWIILGFLASLSHLVIDQFTGEKKTLKIW